jgi:phospholipase C
MQRFTELTRRAIALLATFAMILGTTASPVLAATKDGNDNDQKKNASPIKHVVVIFQENVSFDHYFGTYPNALNTTPGEPQFTARHNTPTVNGYTQLLLQKNPNLNPINGISATNPFRLSHAQALTASQNHSYGPEQAAYDKGVMDIYPKTTGAAGPPPAAPPAIVNTTGLVMGYYDGNTVTAYWNYAQHFAMSDNSFSTGFGPSTPGAINLISGQTNGVTATLNGTGNETAGGNGSLTLFGDADPIGDVCSGATKNQVTMGGKNVGDLLNAAGVSWGFFSGGFDLTITDSNGTTGCKRSTVGQFSGVTAADYVPHHQPFQFYTSTANPAHTRPASMTEIGHNGPANHQYDINDWFTALSAGNLPAVSYLKAISAQDGHPGNSDPLDEQAFVVSVINALQKSADWDSTAVFILYDDSDGWYDHQLSPVLNQSTSPADALTGPGTCGDGSTALPGVTINGVANPHAQGRCGFGPRQPLIVVSPWAKENFVDHSISDQTSVLRFVEDTFLGGTRIGQGSFDEFSNPLTQMFDFDKERDGDSRTLILDTTTGQPVAGTNQDNGDNSGNSGKN